jgi:hypothetical protein
MAVQPIGPGDNMKIAMLTSWNCPCGIAKYSQNLVYAYEKEMPEDTWYVFANKTSSTRPGRVYTDTFIVKWWDEGDAYVNVERINSIIKNMGIELLHIQFQQTFFTVPVLENLLERVNVPTVVTFHDDSSLPKKVGYDKAIVHRYEHLKLFPKSVHIPHPYEVFRPTVFTHGLGRNNTALIKRVCDELDINFDCHDSKVNGWISEEMLMSKMRNADAIVCWYTDMAKTGKPSRVPVAGSGAVRTAVSSYRPVFINDCLWFADVPASVAYRVHDEEQLKSELSRVLHLDEIRSNSYDNFAKKHQAIYKEVLRG